MSDSKKLSWGKYLLLIGLLHQAASLWHCFVSPLPTVGVDSSGFNFFAREMPENGRLNSMFYVQLLHLWYQLVGYSQIVGCQLTHLAFLASFYTYVRFYQQLKLNKYLPFALLVFGILPSCILTTSVTMREAFQMLGFAIFVRALVLLRARMTPTDIFYLIFGSVTLVLFHKGFAIFLLVALPVGLLWAGGTSPERLVGITSLALVLLFLAGDTAWEFMLDRSVALQQMSQGSAIEYIDRYAEQVETGRTDFGIDMDLSSPFSFLSTAPIVLLYYLFSPLPWQLRGALDIVGLAESIVRMYFLYYAFKGYFKARGEQRAVQGFLLFLFFLIEALWAAGTANWGTAIRHRLVAWPLLVGLGGVGLSLQDSSPQNTPQRPLSRRQQIRERRRRTRRTRQPNEGKES